MSAAELDEFIDNDYEFEDESDDFSLSNGMKPFFKSFNSFII